MCSTPRLLTPHHWYFSSFLGSDRRCIMQLFY